MQKINYYVYDDSTGDILISGTEMDTPELRTRVTKPGTTFSTVAPGEPQPVPVLHKVHLDSGAVLRTGEKIPPKKSEKTDELKNACGFAISSGFLVKNLETSVARKYPSSATDQLNMLQGATVGGSLMCYDPQDGEGWKLREHTIEQATEVLSTFVAHRDAQRQILAQKLATLERLVSQKYVDKLMW